MDSRAENEKAFTLEADERAERLQIIFLDDGIGFREIFPHEIAALFDLRDQIEMMAKTGNECAFNELVLQAQELEDAFKNVVNLLGLSHGAQP